MATLYITLSTVQGRALTGATIPAADSIDVGSDKKTTSGTSQLSDLVGQPGQFWTVKARGGDVMVEMGAGTPVAVDDGSRVVFDGIPEDFAVTVANERLAFKDAV